MLEYQDIQVVVSLTHVEQKYPVLSVYFCV